MLATWGAGFPFSPSSLFSAGETGAWYDPSDYSTMFEDSAGTIPITSPLEKPVGKMLDKSGRGNHATQSTTTSRPTLSARVNQYLATETLSTQGVTTLATNYTLKFTGSGTITLSGTATGVYSAGTHTITCTAGTLTSTVAGTVTQADLRASNDGIGLPAYQRVNTATDYDYAGFPPYLKFDGTDDSMATGNIDFTGTDKMFVAAGVRKLSDGGEGTVCELSVSIGTNNGAFALRAPWDVGVAGDYAFQSKGTVFSNAQSAAFLSPESAVLAGQADISTDVLTLRRNASQIASNAADQGTGNYGNYPLYIGRRGGASLPFNGRIYSLIVCGKLASAAEITATEAWVNQKTRAF